MLTRHKYGNHSEFLTKRSKISGKGNPDLFRLGASDVGKVYVKDGRIGLDEWTSPTVFFYECCDYYERPLPLNLPMLRGKIHESVNYSEYWRYFDPIDSSKDAFLQNREEGRIIRSARKSNEIIINERYPWLFMTPDYFISKSNISPRGPLEIKSLSSLENDKYEAEIPEKYVVQIHDQMLIGGWKYGELFDVENQTTPRLYQFHHDKEIQDRILESTHDFWLRVMKGKKIVHSTITQLEKEQMLAELAPEDHGHPLYLSYLKDRHDPERAKETIPGTDEQLDYVVQYLLHKQSLDADGERLQEKQNKIREWFKDGVGCIEWEGVGKISWFKKFTVPNKILKMVGV